jgi:DNA polymerase III subunit epsilon
MTERHLIVVDLECTGLDSGQHQILEVAAIDTTTDEVLHFAPYISPDYLGAADGYAMQVNRYYERGVWKNMLSQMPTGDQYARLHEMLRGNTFAGCNPTFDSQFLTDTVPRFREDVPWHYRLADLSAYAGGALGIPPHELPGLADICERLGVDTGVAHSALDDAKAAAECFRRLYRTKGGAK